ncbi:MAG TPA: OmpA family protein [Verrucomicrobiae bacterium]|nr:OmpA family protein [Verrucomicrobiae bacterium]
MTVVPSRHDGHVGAVVVHKGNEVQVLDTAYATAVVRQHGAIQHKPVDAQFVASRFATASAALPRKSMHFALNFTLANDALTPDSLAKLDQVLAEAADWEAAEFEIVGHTDRVGTPENNEALSLKRAEYVRRALIDKGANPGTVSAIGMGERFPEVATEDGVPNATNRRVEVTIR